MSTGVTWVYDQHRVEQGGQYCSCGQDAVTCQGCGHQICGNFATWIEKSALGTQGNFCETCMQRFTRPIEHKPWIESVMKGETHARCVECRQVRVIKIDAQSVLRWAQGLHIQLAMPTIDVGQREIFLSGLCSSCFDTLIKDDDDDEDERPLDADDFCRALEDLLRCADRADFPHVIDTESFSSAGLLTTDEGIVVRMGNGKTFHVKVSEA